MKEKVNTKSTKSIQSRKLCTCCNEKESILFVKSVATGKESYLCWDCIARLGNAYSRKKQKEKQEEKQKENQKKPEKKPEKKQDEKQKKQWWLRK